MELITGEREDLIEMLNIARKQARDIKGKTDRMAFYNYVGNLYGAINLNSYDDYPIDYKDCFLSRKNFINFLKETDILAKQFGRSFLKHKKFHNDYLYEILSFYEEKMQEVSDVPEFKENKYLGKEKFFEILFGFLSKYGLEKEFKAFLEKKRIFFKIKKHPNDDFLGLTLMNPVDKDTAVLLSFADYDFDTLFTLVHEFGHVVDLGLFTDDISTKSISYAYKSYYPEVFPRILEKLFIHYLVDENIVKEMGIDKYIDYMLVGHDFLISTYMYSLLDDRHFLGPKGFNISEDEFYEQVSKHFKSNDFVRGFIREGNLSLGDDVVYTYGDLMSIHLIEPVLADGLNCIEMRQFMDVRTDGFDPEFLLKNGYTSEHYQKVFSREIDLCKK